MAGSAMKDIKLRIRSVESTRQITSAMQLVAGSKLRRARLRMESTRPYLNASREILGDIAAHGEIDSPFFHAQTGVPCVVVIAGDRGLAGHYNAAVFNLADALIDGGALVLPIGKKAVDRYQHRGAALLSDRFVKAEHVTAGECRDMSNLLIDGFLNGRVSDVTVVSTTFVNAMSQEAGTHSLLPVQPIKSDAKHSQMILEPAPASLLSAIMPDYLTGLLYAYISDAIACEMSARRNAMDSATKNADAMISDLSLRYNRARQGSITQEITEIVAGAEQ